MWYLIFYSVKNFPGKKLLKSTSKRGITKQNESAQMYVRFAYIAAFFY